MNAKHIILSVALGTFVPASFAATAGNDTLPFTYKSFISQQGVEVFRGQGNAQGLALSLYRMGDRFCLEVPVKALGRDILVSMQRTRGYNGWVSPKSGIIRFEKGSSKHSLFMRRNLSVDVQTDSTEVNMMEAIRRSGMLPVDMAFTVLTMGEKEKSYLIDVTSDINTANGLFDVSANSQLNHPDAQRSQVLGIRGIEGGVVIDLMRSQTDMVNNTMTTQVEAASTSGLQFVAQVLPDRRQSMKLADPFYGFLTVSRQEYDADTYVSRRRSYVSKWNFAAGPVTVCISPLMPKSFRESVRRAFGQWTAALQAAGVKNPFVFTTDEKAFTLSYHRICVEWGGTRPNASVVSDPLTGEIVAGRLDVMDRDIDEEVYRYFTLFRHLDRRVAGDMYSLALRQDIIEVQAAAEIGSLLGLKKNFSAADAFSPAQLRQSQWLRKNGPSASVMDVHAFDYVAQPSDGVSAADLFPRVSVYDREAIAYAYGSRTAAPSLVSAYYTYVDESAVIYRPKFTLSTDWLEASRLGIANIRRNYETLHRDMALLPNEQSSFETEHKLVLKALGEYQQMVENVAYLIGYNRVLPVKRGVNGKLNNFTPRAMQINALSFLRAEILEGVSAWTDREELREVCHGNISGMVRAIAVAVYKRLMSKETFGSLIRAEEELGSTTYTAGELCSFIDHELFCDFDEQQAVPEYRKLIQANVIPDLADKAFQADLSLGMADEGALMLNSYFMHVAEKVNYLAKHHTDRATRDNYAMIAMRLNRQYFDKQH